MRLFADCKNGIVLAFADDLTVKYFVTLEYSIK